MILSSGVSSLNQALSALKRKTQRHIVPNMVTSTPCYTLIRAELIVMASVKSRRSPASTSMASRRHHGSNKPQIAPKDSEAQPQGVSQVPFCEVPNESGARRRD